MKNDDARDEGEIRQLVATWMAATNNEGSRHERRFERPVTVRDLRLSDIVAAA